MIPSFNQSGYLPPFISSPANPAGLSPYRVSLYDFVSHFSTSNQRNLIIDGFLKYREAIKKLGITEGFQWVDGSFVEDVEKNKSRPPNDIDIVTFASRPAQYQLIEDWQQFLSINKGLFDPNLTKSQYLCDAYYVDMNLSPFHIARVASYWFGLFSHQRATYQWKGLIEISLSDDENIARTIISGGVRNAS